MSQNYIPSVKVVEKKRTDPKITIEGMVDIMMRLSKERGRVVQYGEVQSELLTGKLKVKGGAVK